MPFERHYDTTSPATLPPCVYLRSKAMYVTGEIKNPEHPDEAGSQNCWCNLTQRVMGPDAQPANRLDCVAGRECHREAH